MRRILAVPALLVLLTGCSSDDDGGDAGGSDGGSSTPTCAEHYGGEVVIGNDNVGGPCVDGAGEVKIYGHLEYGCDDGRTYWTTDDAYGVFGEPAMAYDGDGVEVPPVFEVC